MSGSALYETFARAPLAFDRGEGCWLVTDEGERYLDFAGGIAVNSLGHSHPHLVAALTEQAAKLWHVSNLYEIPGQRRLGERLVDATFADKVFFTNSGAEALECAIKTARRYHYRQRPSRALPHHHLRRRLPRPHAGDHRRRRPVRNISKVSAPRSTASTRSRSTTSTPPRRLISAGDRGDPDRAGAGRGRHPPGADAVAEAAARALRQARPAADLRRGPVRRRPHRQAVRA